MRHNEQLGENIKLDDETISDLASRCAVCGEKLTDPVYALPALAKDRAAMRKCSQVLKVSFPSLGRLALATVAGEASKAKRDGYDLVFALCSQECVGVLEHAMCSEGIPLQGEQQLCQR